MRSFISVKLLFKDVFGSFFVEMIVYFGADTISFSSILLENQQSRLFLVENRINILNFIIPLNFPMRNHWWNVIYHNFVHFKLQFFLFLFLYLSSHLIFWSYFYIRVWGFQKMSTGLYSLRILQWWGIFRKIFLWLKTSLSNLFYLLVWSWPFHLNTL